MQTRRTFLTTSTLALMANTLPGFAQHADLEAESPTDDEPVQRRYMMEDTYGNVVTNEDVQGRFVLVYFGYMSCPDVCPTAMSTVADTLEQLGEDAEKLAVLFVTVDPKRDTAKDLRDYIHFFDKRIIGLRGPKAYTDHMVKVFNARYEFHVPDPDRPDEYAVDHTASIAFLDPAGYLIRRFPHGTSADQIAEDIRTTMAEGPQN